MTAMTKRSPTVRAVARYLEARGIKWRFDRAGRHPRIIAIHGGQEFFITTSCSSKDRDGRHRAVADIRRALRLMEVRA